MTDSLSRLLAFGALALSMALVGSYVALSKPLLAVFPVFLLATLRFSIGAVAMVGWIKKKANEPPLKSSTKRLLFLESFLGNFLFSVCMLYGMRYTTAVAAGIIMSAIPAAVAVMSWGLLKEEVSWKSWVGIACAAIGIGLYSTFKPAISMAEPQTDGNVLGIPAIWIGNLLLALAVLCEASYAVIGKKLTEAMPPKRIAALINAWGFFLALPLGLWAAWHFDFSVVATPVWLLLVFYGLAASVWTVWLWMTGLKKIPANQAGVFTVMLPISAALTGVIFLGEKVSTVQVAAFVIALLGVLVATNHKQPMTSDCQEKTSF